MELRKGPTKRYTSSKACWTVSKLIEIQGDYDSAFRSADFQAKCQTYRIKVQLAAPRHQEQNGLHVDVEAWPTCCN
jgi:hypothetical protein